MQGTEEMQGTTVKTQLIRRLNVVACCLMTVASYSWNNVIADETKAGEQKGISVVTDSEKPGNEGSLVEFIDQQLRQAWSDNEIQPSESATDEEWIRRIYLDLCGRIPTLDEANSFLHDESPRKRFVLIETLLAHVDYVRNFTTIWTNNSIGRVTLRRVSRKGMEKFYREAFAKDRPWDEIVLDVVTASGHYE